MSLIERLCAAGTHRSSDGEFVRADLRGANLAGKHLSLVSLAHARLDGADLTGAQLVQVDLRCATLDGARLSKTRLELVDAGSASFASAVAAESRWWGTNLTGANFTNADLRRASLSGTVLQSARFDGANLSRTTLADCVADDASFRDASLTWSNTSGTGFAGADFTGAKQFFLCREIVVEILSRNIGNDAECAKLVGAAALMPKWCYPEWKEILAIQTEYRDLALRIFERYPESGFEKALRDGLVPTSSKAEA